MRGEFVSVGVTLDKRRGLYVVLTPRFSTEKQPLSPTWRPPWTSVTTIAEEHTYRWWAERCRLRSIRRIFIFLTLSHHPHPPPPPHPTPPHPHLLIPFSHPRPSISVLLSSRPFFRRNRVAFFFLLEISSFISFLLPSEMKIDNDEAFARGRQK